MSHGVSRAEESGDGRIGEAEKLPPLSPIPDPGWRRAEVEGRHELCSSASAHTIQSVGRGQ